MTVSWRYIFLAGVSASFMAGAAEAGCKKGCPAPPPPPPPCNSCGHNGGHYVRTPDIKIGAPRIKIGGTNVKVNHGGVFVNQTRVNVNVDASASAAASASASGAANGSGGGSVVVGGGGGYFAPAPAPSMGALNICIEQEELIQKTHLVEAMIALRAACIDDRGAPHPASQLWPEEHVEAGYEGELYRCAAGSYLQVTLGTAEGSYDGASTIVCKPGEALYHTPNGKLFCRPQNPERNCFERSLLRKYGPGAKILRVKREETYTETQTKACPADSGGFLLSGGVGAY